MTSFLELYVYVVDSISISVRPFAATVRQLCKNAHKPHKEIVSAQKWKQKKKLDEGSDYQPPISHKSKENKQGFVSWCHANLWTGGTETELDLQVPTASQAPAFLDGPSVWVALLYREICVSLPNISTLQASRQRCLCCIVKSYFIVCPEANRHPHTHFNTCFSELVQRWADFSWILLRYRVVWDTTAHAAVDEAPKERLCWLLQSESPCAEALYHAIS